MNATATIAPGRNQTTAINPSGAADLDCPETLDATGDGRGDGVGGPQYMRALERANKVRLARADLKRRVATGEMQVAEVILDCPWQAESMAVADLLMSQRRWGQTRCRKFLAQIPMSEKKTIGSMTDRQRRTLASMLTSPERGRGWNATPWVTDSLS